MIGTGALILLVLAADPAPKANFPVSKETTYVTGPLDAEGFVDYQAALNDLLGKGITPENNAMVLLVKALGPRPGGHDPMPAEFYRRLGIPELPENGDYFIPLSAFLKDRLKLADDEQDAIHEQLTRAYQRVWSDEEYPQIAAWLAANEKPLATVVEAIKRHKYYLPIVGSGDDPHSLLNAKLSPVQASRELVRALCARALLRVSQKKFDDAWQDLLACHRLGRHVAGGGGLVEAIVGIAIDAMASAADLAFVQAAPAGFQNYSRDLAHLPPFPEVADKFDRAERFYYLQALQSVPRDGIGIRELVNLIVDNAVQKKANPKQLETLRGLDWAPALRKGNQWYDRIAAAMRMKDREGRMRELAKIESDVEALRQESAWKLLGAMLGNPKQNGEIITALLFPATQAAVTASDRCEQIQRNLKIALALAAYKHDRKSYPMKLSELAPRYVAEVHKDVYGNDLIYRPSATGYVLYSTGPDGVDEDGRSYDDEPIGDDLMIRMPLSELKVER